MQICLEIQNTEIKKYAQTKGHKVTYWSMQMKIKDKRVKIVKALNVIS